MKPADLPTRPRLFERDRLIEAAEKAAQQLAAYFEHDASAAVRDAVRDGTISADAIYKQLVRSLLRALVLTTLGARGCLPSELSSPTRLYDIVSDPSNTPLSGLFEPHEQAGVHAATVSQRALEQVIDTFSATTQSQLLTGEDLGCVYESLLELVPRFSDGQLIIARKETKGHARRKSGSYYTPEDLIRVVLDGALDPVILRALDDRHADPAHALLELKVLDPACGAGHFLVAAAKRLATHLARVETTSPSESAYRDAMRRIVSSSIYGIDLDAVAVELCKVSLWLECAEPGSFVAIPQLLIRQGNALCRAPVTTTSQAEADAWCVERMKPNYRNRSSFKQVEGPVADLPKRHTFFHPHLAFPEAMARGSGKNGFDVIIGNPPWIAHAGRAAQQLAPELKAFFLRTYEAFADYPTTHGMFVTAGAQLLRRGGMLGLVIPSSLSELDGYAPTRRAHDKLCRFPNPLVDFGEGRFEGVTQPCMALISQRDAAGRNDAEPGSPWPMDRPDLTPLARRLMSSMAELPCLPPSLFGERGIQSDKALTQHFRMSAAPMDRFATPIREGTDIREFELLPPRMHVDIQSMSWRFSDPAHFGSVRFVIRQTARFPIAALSDGLAFRNSLLAGFDSDEWPADALIALLNSSLVRWFHYVRFRDARQPIMPQLKIGHLRAVPCPKLGRSEIAELSTLGQRLTHTPHNQRSDDRMALDTTVFRLFQLGAAEQALVTAWHREIGASRKSVRGSAKRIAKSG